MMSISRFAAKALLPVSVVQAFVLPLAGCLADRTVTGAEEPPTLQAEQVKVVKARGRLTIKRIKESRQGPVTTTASPAVIAFTAQGTASPDVRLLRTGPLLVEEGALPPGEDEPPSTDVDYPIAAFNKSTPNLSLAMNQLSIDTSSGAVLTAVAPAASSGQPNTDITFAKNGLITTKVMRTWQSVGDLWVIATESTMLYDSLGEPYVLITFTAEDVQVEEVSTAQLAELGYEVAFAKACVAEFLTMMGMLVVSAGVCANAGAIWILAPECFGSILVFIGSVADFIRCAKGG